jgi:hypothetical protein
MLLMGTGLREENIIELRVACLEAFGCNAATSADWIVCSERACDPERARRPHAKMQARCAASSEK